jgi:hypothetical protein
MLFALGIPLYRFNVGQLHRMRDTGVLAPRARVELLDGILVDKHRPSARELAAIQRIAGVLSEHLDAPIVAGEPHHPDGYATFDPAIMVHDWEHLFLTEPWLLHRFSVGAFDRMFKAGILTKAERVELLDGVVLEALPPASDATVANIASRVAAETFGGVVRRRSAVELGPYSRLWIDMIVCRRRRVACDAKPATGSDVRRAVDIVSPPELAQQLRWPLYARWGVEAAWIIDPAGGEFRAADFSRSIDRD